MGFRGSRVQIPPSRLSEEQALQRVLLWGFCLPSGNTGEPPFRASGGETQEIRVRNLVECLRHAGAARSVMRGRPTCSCDRPNRKHIATLLRCTDPRGAMSCGSPMPRGEQIAKPAERGTRLAGPFFCRESWAGTARAGHTERSPQSILSRSPPCELSASVSAL